MSASTRVSNRKSRILLRLFCFVKTRSHLVHPSTVLGSDCLLMPDSGRTFFRRLLRPARRGSISSLNEDASTGRCTGERRRSRSCPGSLQEVGPDSSVLQAGLRTLRPLCFRDPFSQSRKFRKNFRFWLFAFVLLRDLSIFQFSLFQKKIIFSSRSIALRDTAHTT